MDLLGESEHVGFHSDLSGSENTTDSKAVRVSCLHLDGAPTLIAPMIETASQILVLIVYLVVFGFQVRIYLSTMATRAECQQRVATIRGMPCRSNACVVVEIRGALHVYKVCSCATQLISCVRV